MISLDSYTWGHLLPCGDHLSRVSASAGAQRTF